VNHKEHKEHKEKGKARRAGRRIFSLCSLCSLWFLCLILAGCGKPQSTELTAHGKPLSHWLGELASAADPKARQHAARILGNVGGVDPAVVPALTEATKDKAPEVRKEATAALEKIKK